MVSIFIFPCAYLLSMSSFGRCLLKFCFLQNWVFCFLIDELWQFSIFWIQDLYFIYIYIYIYIYICFVNIFPSLVCLWFSNQCLLKSRMVVEKPIGGKILYLLSWPKSSFGFFRNVFWRHRICWWIGCGVWEKKGSRVTSRFLIEQLEGWSLLKWRRVLCDSKYVGLFSLGSHSVLW